MKMLLNKMKRTWLGSITADWIDKMCVKYPQMCEEMNSFLHETRHRVYEDMRNATELLLKDPSVRYGRSVLRRYLDMVSEDAGKEVGHRF